jgi:hypothetical protein
MQRTVIAKTPSAARARLNLAPRFRHDETLSSWLERFAAAYGLKLSEFLRWLGYEKLFFYAQPLIDLDQSPPADLAQIMRPHAGIGPEVIEQHRLVGDFADIATAYVLPSVLDGRWAVSTPRMGERLVAGMRSASEFAVREATFTITCCT